MKKFAIVAAAGSGTRMGRDMPKQFLEINGKPVLYYTLKAFIEAFDDITIILVVHPEYMDYAHKIAGSLAYQGTIHIIAGASSRFGSIKAGLKLVNDDSIVFVHDGARCFPTTNLIHRCYKEALSKGNAVPAIIAADSVRIVKYENNEAVDRNSIFLVQTPQTFRASLLKQAYENAATENFTDDASVAENNGIKIHLVEGESTNIKITFPIDLLLAEKIMGVLKQDHQ